MVYVRGDEDSPFVFCVLIFADGLHNCSECSLRGSETSLTPQPRISPNPAKTSTALPLAPRTARNGAVMLLDPLSHLGFLRSERCLGEAKQFTRAVARLASF